MLVCLASEWFSNCQENDHHLFVKFSISSYISIFITGCFKNTHELSKRILISPNSTTIFPTIIQSIAICKWHNALLKIMIATHTFNSR